ncbi:MAG: type I polyketide synthase, partial [Gemmataceae bacterium]
MWDNLLAGVEAVRFLTDAELDPSVPADERTAPGYVRAAATLGDVAGFDAAFFGITPREAEVMDPQQRLFLETAWHALEHAGHVPEKTAGTIGIFAGEHNNTYREWSVSRRPDAVERLGAFQTMVASEKDYLATRAAHALDLTGPAISLNTACSTSLVAVVQAVHALRTRQCDVALAGGVTVLCPPNRGYFAQDGGMLSPDGHTRPFDAQAAGTVFGSGVGVVVLRRLADAVRDGDTIHAVIRGAAVNNDGGRKVSFSAPAVQGQAEVIARALAMAGVDPDAVGYVEAHGTATPVGDPVEVEALTQVFREKTDRKSFCILGSLKSNVGHLVAAAGVAGLIKATLALKHEVIPPTLHFQTPNPRIDWANSPFRVSAVAVPWPRGDRLRFAGVSSFGVGGTNAHVILEEAPLASPAPDDDRPQLLPLTARSAEGLAQAVANLAAHLQSSNHLLADVAWTLQVGRRDFAHRRFVVARTAAEAVDLLRQAQPAAAPLESAAPRVVVLFPGQGAQHPGMGHELYARSPVFREWIDRAANVLAESGVDLRELLFGADAERLGQTAHAQPALFAFGHALAKQWQAWGVEPALAVGHSVGEFVAACLAGVFSFEDGLRLISLRARLMQAQAAGVMLSVRRPADEVRGWLDDASAIASINAPSLCVVSGPEASITAVEARCEREGVACRRLHTSHAFHSPMMDAVIEPFLAAVRQVPLNPPRLPIVSTVTGELLTPAQATDPAYWAGHLRATVRFADAVRRAAESAVVFLECGPRNTLAVLARQQTSR